MRPLEPALARYGVAVALAIGALALRDVMTPLWGVKFPLITFFPAVMISAWLGGLGPGVTTTLLCAASVAYRSLLSPKNFQTENWGDLVGLFVFVVIGLLMSMTTDTLHRIRRRLVEKVRQLEDEKRTRRAGEEAQARTAAIVQSSDDAIIGKTLDSTITSWNAGAERMFGFTAEEVIGRSISIIIPPDRLSEEERVMSAIRRGEVLAHFETVRWRKDGTAISISQTISPIKNAAGEIIGASNIARDISARKQAEEERALLLRAMEVARAEAEAANRAKDQFLAMLGHELRNPLGAISNAIQVLRQRGGREDVAAQATNVIARQVSQLARLTDDLFDVSRVISGRVVLEREPLELLETAERAVNTLRTAGKINRQTVTLEGQPVWVDADAARIEQIVINLVGNALKYTPPGGSVLVRVTHDGQTGLISVEDTGAGISPDLLPHVFDAFFQGAPPPDRAQGGLGIGLTLVKQLAELHAGRVEARSDGPGKGSIFTVRFPMIARPALRPRPSGPSGDRQAPPSASGLRVLVIEDNDDSREMLRSLLELSGHVVTVASNGPSGVEAALVSHPDIAFVDIGLPGFDGYEVARRLRAAPQTKGLRLIAVTGYGLPGDNQRAHEAGFDAYLTKPIHGDKVAEIFATAQRAP
jgi:two-component system CheB/CheR fusion protein